MNAKRMLIQAAGAVLIASVTALPTVAEVTLPEGYTRLDYIESTGSQYIDTGYCLQHDDKVVAEMSAPKVQPNPGTARRAFGFNEGGTGASFLYSLDDASSGRIRYDRNGQGARKPKGNAFNRDIRCVFTTTEMRWENVDGTGDECTLALPAASAARDAVLPFYVFANSEYDKNGAVVPAANSDLKLYSLQVRSADGNTTKLDLVPCRDPNGVLGLYNVGSYDIPDGNFLANKGTGTFRTSDLDGTRILSIEATGGQYIDTCHKFKYNDVVTADMMLPKEQSKSTSSTYTTAFGANDGEKYLFNSRAMYNGRFELQRLDGSGNGLEAWSPGDRTPDYFYNQRVTFTLDWSTGLRWTNADGTNTGSLNFSKSTSTKQATLPAFIFAYSRMPENNIITLAALNNSIGTLYAFDIASAGTTQKRFVPFRRSDNRVGLLDLIEGRFYPNNSTTAFVAGEDLYAVDGRSAVFDAGTYMPELANELAESFDLVRKAGSGTFEAGNATGFEALSIEAGTYSVQDGVAKRQVIDGTLALKGGATLKVDVTPNGCDSFAAGAVDLSDASSANRITIHVTLAEGASIGTTGVTLIESGVSAADVNKFTVVGQIPISKVEVRDGALVLKQLLPDGYTRLDYIESTGSQYIDTGYFLLYDDVVAAELSAPKVQPRPNTYMNAFGFQESAEGTAFLYSLDSGAVGRAQYARNGQASRIPNMNAFNRDIRCVFTPTEMRWENVDGTGDACTLAVAASSAADAVLPFYVFASSTYGQDDAVVPTANSALKLRSLQVLSSDGNTVKLDLIPCRTPDGVLGLFNAGSYDIPGGNFLVNKGTGTFRTSDLDGVRIASIESTGAQYIDTCHKFKYDDVVTADMMIPKVQSDKTSSTYVTAFGSTGSDLYLFNSRAMYNGRFELQRIGADGKEKQAWSPGDRTPAYFYDQRMTFTLNWATGLSWINADGTTTGSLNFSDPLSMTQAPLPAFIFAYSRMTDGTIKTLGALNNSLGTLYSFDITSGDGTAQKRFVPFRRSDNRVGLLDLVGGRFYPNESTTAFVAGADLYTVDDRTAIVEAGSSLPELVTGFDLVRKTGSGTFDAAGTAEWKALSIEAGTYSVQDGAAKRQVIDGTLALKGGATLKVDVTPDSCDSFAAGALDLSGASVTDRVTIDVSWLGDVSLRGKTFTLIESGLSKEDANKFRVIGGKGNMGVKVVDGALVLCVRSMFVIVH